MGLFNFIYKLTNILSNKRKIKVFVIIALIILLLFLWSRGAFASEISTEISPQNSDALMNYQLQMQSSLCAYLRFVYQQQARGYDNSAFMDLIDRMYNFNVCVMAGNNGQDLIQFKVYTYSNKLDNNYNIFTVDGEFSLGLTSGTKYPCKLGNIVPNAIIDVVVPGNGRTTPVVNTNVSSFYMPDSFYLVRSTEINKLLEEFGKFSKLETTFETSDEELQSITSSGFSAQVQATNNLNSTMQDVNSSVEDVNQSVMDMINTIVDPYVNVSQQQLPSQEVTDGTAEPLNTLFDYIRNAFTGDPTGFSLPLPFVGGEVRIEPDAIQTSMRNARSWYIGNYN